MNDFLDKASHFTQNTGIAETTIEDIEQLAKDYPYFPVTQVLLAKKYSLENHENFIRQAQKTALYFTNPYRLHYHLMETFPEISITEPGENNEPQNEAASAAIIPESDQVITGEPAQVPDAIAGEPKRRTTFTNDEIAAASILAKETLAGKTEDEEVNEAAVAPDEFHPEQEEVLEEISENNNDLVETTVAKTVPEEMEQIPDSLPGLLQSAPGNRADDATGKEEVVESDLLVQEAIPNSEEDIIEQPVLQEPVVENQLPPTVPANPLKNSDTAPSTGDDNQIPIEPYYTVDYFASQGIKLDLDKNPQDKLGKQLRSFTAWLRHMKKLGPEDALKTTPDVEADSAIKQIANTSNTPEEIITEAMADVLIKQGKHDQAIEVYHKLSFLNPDKSPYFADQIQKLKDS